jgi:hypothetical protein
MKMARLSHLIIASGLAPLGGCARRNTGAAREQAVYTTVLDADERDDRRRQYAVTIVALASSLSRRSDSFRGHSWIQLAESASQPWLLPPC